MRNCDRSALSVTNPEELEKQYRRRFDAQVEYRGRVWSILTADYFQKLVAPTSAILDLGCGYGQFINHIQATKKFAMDLNPGARANLKAGVNFIQQDCSTRWPFDDATLDVVFSSNFLEHLRTKELIQLTLQEARRCLAPGGKIILLGPNVRYVPGAYWDFWDHHVPLSDRTVVEVLELTNFAIDESIPKFLPFTMADGPPAPLLMIRVYLRLRAAWAIFGRQFLVIGRAI